jgi:putative phosphoribosyl transferase
MTHPADETQREPASQRHHEVVLPPLNLKGLLTVPAQTYGLVLFAHGSGSSRLSPRNRFVAAELGKTGLATLLFDLLSEQEASDRRYVFDIALLAERLDAATAWVAKQDPLNRLPLGYFGASTGAAAALVAAAQPENPAVAVVSRGGRPDLAGPALARVRCPTLLIVGERDEAVLALNETAFLTLRGDKSLAIVPGATHLFEEPGTLAQVVALARRWFERHLRAPPEDK